MIESKLKVITIFFALCFTWCLPANSQVGSTEQEEILSKTEGFFLEGHLQGHGLTVEDDDADDGGGLGIKAGYGFSPLFTLYLGIDGASMNVADPATQSFTANEYSLVYVDLGGRFNFRSGPHSVVPYIDTFVTGIASTYNTGAGDVTFSGSGVSVGGGVQYFFSPQFAFNGGLDFTFGSYDEVEGGGGNESVDLGVTGARIDIGFSWYPSN